MLHPVVLSGGSGSRLWPLSRQNQPKQFLRLIGDHSLYQETVIRASKLPGAQPPVTVCSEDHRFMIGEQLQEVAIASGGILLEPTARNTAPAIALAALNADPDSLLLAMPSDHVVRDNAAFLAAVEAARPLAAEDWLVTFGIRPDRPETGYGYVRRGDSLGPGVFKAERFIEKPDRATAERFLAGGGYDWNGGIFLLRAGAYLAALERHAPYLLPDIRAAVTGQSLSGARAYPDAQGFARVPGQSIDHAVMEKSDRVAVVPVAMGWSDIGSWEALHAIGDKDGADNVLAGDVVAIDSAGCLVRSDGPVVVTLGVEDLVVVATERSVLIVPRGKSQRVGEAVDALVARGHRPPRMPEGA